MTQILARRNDGTITKTYEIKINDVRRNGYARTQVYLFPYIFNRKSLKYYTKRINFLKLNDKNIKFNRRTKYALS